MSRKLFVLVILSPCVHALLRPLLPGRGLATLRRASSKGDAFQNQQRDGGPKKADDDPYAFLADADLAAVEALLRAREATAAAAGAFLPCFAWRDGSDAIELGFGVKKLRLACAWAPRAPSSGGGDAEIVARDDAEALVEALRQLVEDDDELAELVQSVDLCDCGRAQDDEDNGGLGAASVSIGLLEPHKRFQNSVSIFQRRPVGWAGEPLLTTFP